MIVVNSPPRILGKRCGIYPPSHIRAEPQLFNCDMKHAYILGGPITQQFLSALPPDWHDEPVVVDTRVHMLMEDWFPAIPGWHLDDVCRNTTSGQPNFETPEYRSFHIMALQNAEICPTEFISSDWAVNVDPERVYESANTYLWKNEGHIARQKVRSGELYLFDDRTFHRCTPAVGRGWRWFGRVSRYFHGHHGTSMPRPNERTNEMRTQTQVYLSALGKGW